MRRKIERALWVGVVCGCGVIALYRGFIAQDEVRFLLWCILTVLLMCASEIFRWKRL